MRQVIIVPNLIKFTCMKTFVHSVILIALLVIGTKSAHAQCTVSNIIIQNVTVAGSQQPGTCTVTFDATFTIENNNGNKFIFIHAWLMDDYPNYFDCVNGVPSHQGTIRAPGQTDLARAFINIGIDNSDSIPELLLTYPPASGVVMTSVQSISREITADGSGVFILTGITATLPIACGTPRVIVADVWSSQSARAQNAHCVNCGILYSAGFLSLAGIVNCTSLSFNATLTNNTNTAINGFYVVHADINGDGYFTPSIDTMIQDTTNFSVSAGVGATATLSGSVPAANLNQDLFIVLTQTSGAASGASRVVLIPSIQCAPLPVAFRTFKASRMSRTQVILEWETATEVSNRGFALQKRVGGDWQVISFVPSQATDGNSNSILSYRYTDNNNFQGISQYRIQQVDLDGRARLSDIRVVRGFGQSGKTIIYPVPSTDGKVNVVFEDAESVRDITLMDMNGRVIRQWNALVGNNIQIDNLRVGMYNIRITDRTTGESTSEKFVVSGN